MQKGSAFGLRTLLLCLCRSKIDEQYENLSMAKLIIELVEHKIITEWTSIGC